MLTVMRRCKYREDVHETVLYQIFVKSYFEVHVVIRRCNVLEGSDKVH